MATKNRIASCLMFVSLLAWGTQASSQRGNERGHNREGRSAHHGQREAGRAGGAHQVDNRAGNAHAGNANRSGQYAHNGNRNYNGNHNYNRNTNVNVNRNVNVNSNVHWNGNYWGGARVYANRYSWPHGYGYVRRSVGWVMPAAFMTSAYFYAGWANLGLAAPPPQYQWVRYGPDLLLVNTVTGQVTDVRYGVFAG